MTFADIIVLIVVATIVGWAVYIHFFKNRGDLCSTCSYKKTCDIKKEELRREINEALDERQPCSRP
jgi:hypothetical protein